MAFRERTMDGAEGQGHEVAASGTIQFRQSKKRDRDGSSETRSGRSARKKLQFVDGAHGPSSASSTFAFVPDAVPKAIDSVLIDVPASMTELHTVDELVRERKVKRKPIRLPHLVIKKSQVAFGGLGVFANEAIPKGSWVTEYGGEVISYDEASRRRLLGEDTHIRSLGVGRAVSCLDSRLRGSWDLDYYKKHHMMGGILNDAHGTDHKNNCEYVPVECSDYGYQHPYEGGSWMSSRVYLRTTRDVSPGDELFVSYGNKYHDIHF